MVAHEAEIFPNVITPATSRHDRECLYSDLRTHVLSNCINTMIKMGGYPILPRVGPWTVVVVDAFDFQRRNRKRFITDNSRDI